MTKRERVEAVYALQPADRVPFVPAIYEHKGVLIGKSPSEICRSAEWLCAGLRAELEVYDADMLVIGIDVYNVEAEALGCKVVYFAESNDVPGIVEPIVRSPADLARLGVPDPARDGRMPVYLGAARQLYAEMGREVILRGAVTGPYSMAAELIGARSLCPAHQWTIPPSRGRRLSFCARVTVEFGKALPRGGPGGRSFSIRAPTPDAGFAARGAGVAVCRSTATMCWPELKAARRPLSAPDHRRQHDVDHRRSPRHPGPRSSSPTARRNLARWCAKALAARVPRCAANVGRPAGQPAGRSKPSGARRSRSCATTTTIRVFCSAAALWPMTASGNTSMPSARRSPTSPAAM